MKCLAGDYVRFEGRQYQSRRVVFIDCNSVAAERKICRCHSKFRNILRPAIVQNGVADFADLSESIESGKSASPSVRETIRYCREFAQCGPCAGHPGIGALNRKRRVRNDQ